ncbi:MAG: hypothetical protein QF415_00455 [Candidatus Undinarchaeales archaeon]|nr:hypothetical protein [Candidatus Undinarchaeales archaeon]
MPGTDHLHAVLLIASLIIVATVFLGPTVVTVEDTRPTRAKDPGARLSVEGPPSPGVEVGPPAPTTSSGPEGPPVPMPTVAIATTTVDPDLPEVIGPVVAGWAPVPSEQVPPARPTTVRLLPPRGPDWLMVLVTREAVEPCDECLSVDTVNIDEEFTITIKGPDEPVVPEYNLTINIPIPPGWCVRTLKVKLCTLRDDGTEGRCSSFQNVPEEMVDGNMLQFDTELPATINTALDFRCDKNDGSTTQVTVAVLPRWGADNA